MAAANVPNRTVTLVVLGDCHSGRTCLRMSYEYGEYPTRYIPTILENSSLDKTVDGETVHLMLFEVPLPEEFDLLRPFRYPDADICLILVRVDCLECLNHAETVWLRTIQVNCPRAKYILVGSQIDRRADNDAVAKFEDEHHRPMISPSEGEAFARRINAWGYMECSALTREGVDELFDEAIRTVIHDRDRMRPSLFKRISDIFKI